MTRTALKEIIRQSESNLDLTSKEDGVILFALRIKEQVREENSNLSIEESEQFEQESKTLNYCYGMNFICNNEVEAAKKAFGTFLANLESFEVFASDLELFADSDSKNLTTNYPNPLKHERIKEKVTQLIEILDETLKIKAKISKSFPAEVTDNLFQFAEYIAKRDYGQQRITLKLIDRQEQELTEINAKLENTGRHDLEHASEEAMQLQLRKQELEDNLNTLQEYYDSNVQILYDTARHMPEEYLHMMSASWGYYGSFKNAMQSKLNEISDAAHGLSKTSGVMPFIFANSSTGIMYGLALTTYGVFTVSITSSAIAWVGHKIITNIATDKAKEIQKILPSFLIQPADLAYSIFTTKLLQSLNFEDEAVIKSSFMMQIHKAEQNQPPKWHHKLVNAILCCCCRRIKEKKFDIDTKAADDVRKLFIKIKKENFDEVLKNYDLCELEDQINPKKHLLTPPRDSELIQEDGAGPSGIHNPRINAAEGTFQVSYVRDSSIKLADYLGGSLVGINENFADIVLL